jgi:acetolactate synthase small subunit
LWPESQNMKQDYTLELESDNNFSVLNRIINILNRRRVRIKKMMAHENEANFRRGGVIMLLHTTADMMERVKDQLEKLIEVDRVEYQNGSHMYTELSERVVDVD